MSETMLKIDRSAVDKAIKNMEMFTATNQVLADYEVEKKILEDRGKYLSERLAQLQEQHTTAFLDREVAKDNPSDYIYLSKQLTELDKEVNILLSLQDQHKEEFAELKKKYMPIIRNTYNKDMSAKSDYFNVNEAVAHVTNVLKQAISDYEKEIHKQNGQVMTVIYDDFLDDKELMNESWDDPDSRRNALAFKRAFEFGRNDLSYDRTINL